MAKQTINGQQKLISQEEKIISRIRKRYPITIPEYEVRYLLDLERKIKERGEWIKNQIESEG